MLYEVITIGKETETVVNGVVNSVILEVDSLMGGMEETNTSIQEISNGSHNLSKQSARVSELSSKSSQGLQQIQSVMGDLTTAVSIVTNDTTSVVSLTQEADQLSIEGTKLVEKTKDGMHTIKESFEETQQVVTDISQQMIEINSIIDLIGGIADQTNFRITSYNVCYTKLLRDARFNGGWTHKLNGLKHDVTASLEVRERPTLSEGALGIYLSNSIDGLDSAITALSNLVNSTLPSNLG